MEGDTTLRETLAELFREEGFRVASEISLPGVQALLELGGTVLVIADGWGPSYATLQAKELGELRDLARRVPVLLYSGRMWALHPPSVELGNVAIVVKPADIDDLIHAAHKTIGRAPALGLHAEVVHAWAADS
jgi:DNA-binding NtrC family response regulator